MVRRFWVSLAFASVCFFHSVPIDAAVGRTMGSHEVTTSGSSRYTIPIWTPAASGGLAPQLAIDYHQGRDNGIVGMGFQITGFSVITRCAKTIAQDGANAPITLSSSDVYCLDGDRLRLTSGTYGLAGSAYRTEVDRLVKILAFGGSAANGPNYFEVWHKDGLIYEYGNSDSTSGDALITAYDEARVHSWALNAIRDRTGNRIDFSYIEDKTNGVFRPNDVKYTTNANAFLSTAPYRVLFLYEALNRSDPILGLHAFGGIAREYKRLDRIEVQHNSSPIRIYKFTYQGGAGGQSRVEEIQECSTTVDTDHCLAATEFEWTNASAAYQSEQALSTSIPIDANLIDVDGNGMDDLVYVSSSGVGGTWRIRKALETGGYDNEIPTEIANTNYLYALPLEWDGDGRTDLIYPLNVSGTLKWHVLRSNGSGFDPAVNTTITAVDPARTRAYDMNGDGKHDLVRVSSSGEAIVYVRYRNATGFDTTETITWRSWDSNVSFDSSVSGPLSPVWFQYRSGVRQADFNGDGREDFIAWMRAYDPESQLAEVFVTRFINGEAAGPLEMSADLGGSHLYGDLNDDGLTDIVWVKVAGTLRIVYGGSSDVVVGPSMSGFNSNKYVIGDFDADGRQDILAQRASTAAFEYFRSTGVGIAAPTPTGLSHAAFSTYRIGNVNGDPHLDFISYGGGTVKYALHQPTPADLLKKVTDGFGTSVEFEYLPMTDSTVYTKGSGTPGSAVTLARPIVRRVKTSDGTGSSVTYDTTYTYEGARFNYGGRGFLGFAKRMRTDSRNGIFIEEEFSQDSTAYASIGMPTKTTVKQSSSGKPIRQETITWGEHVTGSGFTQRRLAYVASIVVDDYEVGGTEDGVLFRKTTTTNTVDAYGTVTSSTVATQEKATGLNDEAIHTEVTTIPSGEIVNSEADWCLGRPKRLLTTRTPPGGTALTRRVDYTWNEPKCRLTREKIEPASAKWLQTDLAYDDDTGFSAPDFGNLARQTVSSASTANRVASFKWDVSTGRFVEELTREVSPANHVITRTWNAALGLIASETAPDGTSASMTYDDFGRLIKVVHPDGTMTMHDLTACTTGNSWCGTNDKARYQVRTTKRQDDETTVLSEQFGVLDSFGRVLRTRQLMLGSSYSQVDSTFDSMGRLATRTFPYYSTDGYFTQSFQYDLIDRPRFVTRPKSDDTGAPSVTIENVYEGLVKRFIDGEGRQTRYIENSIGEIVSATRALGTASAVTSTYSYDAFGNPKTLVGPDSATITHTYDDRGFRTRTVDPNLGTWDFDYWPTGELKSVRDAKTQAAAPAWTTSFAFDTLGRMTARTDHSEITTTTWTWDSHTGTTCTEGQSGGWGRGKVGAIAQVENSVTVYSEAYCYDSKGRLSAKRVTTADGAFGFQWAYHSDTGDLYTITYPAAPSGARPRIRYEMSNGHLYRVRDDNNPNRILRSNVQRTARGQVKYWQDTEHTNPDCLTTLYCGFETNDYDAVTGHLMERTSEGVAAPWTGDIQHWVFTWDRAGNLLSREDQLRTSGGQYLKETFEYDPLYRLTKVKDAFGTDKLTLGYLANGNISSKSDLTGDDLYEYDTAHKHAATRAGGGGSPMYAYDLNGNMTSRNGNTISWYSYNLPLRINGASGSYSDFWYGPDRQRYKQVSYNGATSQAETTIYIDGLFEKRTTAGTTAYHYPVFAEGELIAIGRHVSGSTFEFTTLHKDALGGVTGLAEIEYLTTTQSFDAWGKRRDEAGWSSGPPSSGSIPSFPTVDRRGYTGHEHLDNLELVHMNGRVYDPVIGRFLSPDPFIPDPYDPQSLNRYSYVRNNPMSRTDPSGFRDCMDCGGRVTFGMVGYGNPFAIARRMSVTFTVQFSNAVGVSAPGAAPSELKPDFVKFDLGIEAQLAAMGIVGFGPYNAGVPPAFMGAGWNPAASLPTDDVLEGLLRGLHDLGMRMALEQLALGVCGPPNVSCQQIVLSILPHLQLGPPDSPSGNFWYDVSPGVGIVLGPAGWRLGARFLATQASVVSREIRLIDGFYRVEGSPFKFSKYYYERLWATGRGAPFVQAEEILRTATKIAKDSRPGFYRYTNDYFEMVYNPTTGEIWHMMPLR